MKQFTAFVFISIYIILGIKLVLDKEITNWFLFISLISYLEYKTAKED